MNCSMSSQWIGRRSKTFLPLRGIQERCLYRVEDGSVANSVAPQQVEVRGTPQAPARPPGMVPLLRRLPCPALNAQVLLCKLDPALQRLPAAEQCFVRHLDCGFVNDKQAGSRELLDQPPRRRRDLRPG